MKQHTPADPPPLAASRPYRSGTEVVGRLMDDAAHDDALDAGYAELRALSDAEDALWEPAPRGSRFEQRPVDLDRPTSAEFAAMVERARDMMNSGKTPLQTARALMCLPGA